MPAGVSWSRYLFFVGSAIASMLAGGATVRWILKPDLVSLSLSVTDTTILIPCRQFQNFPHLNISQSYIQNVRINETFKSTLGISFERQDFCDSMPICILLCYTSTSVTYLFISAHLVASCLS